MLKVLLCCFMNSTTEPVHIDIVPTPRQSIAYRPDSIIAFSEKEKEYFKSLAMKKKENDELR